MRAAVTAVLVVAGGAVAWGALVTVDASREVARVPPGFYGAGYDGWGDITDPGAVERLKELPLSYLRVAVDPARVCGAKPGEYDLQSVTDRDLGLGFTDRLKLIVSLGWRPMPAWTISHSLPPWFHGEVNDDHNRAWFRYDTDGTLHEQGRGNQLEAWSQVTRDVAAGLRAAGLSGLHWETIYELGHTMPLDEIHYHGAKGIREADPTAKLIGPATWPGWTVEERFVKPYLTKYGPDLLDYVSVHWYASNEHSLWETPDWGRAITMADSLWLQYLIETTPKYETWCQSLGRLLDDRQLNPTGKRIGIAFTELDANANSPYAQTPPNPRYPDYDPAADCYVNTNVFGGVWLASTLCHLARSGRCDIALKFNTRQYYGLIDHATPGEGSRYVRTPAWYALRLLTHVAGLRDGAPLLEASVEGPLDSAAAHKVGEDSPWLECYATRAGDALTLILINRGLVAEETTIAVSGLAGGEREVTRYLFDAERNQRFIGRPPADPHDGHFEGEDRARCLEPVDSRRVEVAEGRLLLDMIACPALSITVLTIVP